MGGEAGEREGDEREGKKGNERMVEEWRKYGSEDGEQRRGQSKDRRREKVESKKEGENRGRFVLCAWSPSPPFSA